MILRNWMNFMMRTNHEGTSIKNTAGETYYLDSQINFNTVMYGDLYSEVTGSINSPISIGIAIGSGNTSPAIDDYKMESAITSNLNAGGTAVGHDVSYSRASSVTITQPIQNLGSATIVVNEVGIFGRNSGYTGASVLLTRDVLTSPVEIAPNETKTFVVTIDLSQMSTSVTA